MDLCSPYSAKATGWTVRSSNPSFPTETHSITGDFIDLCSPYSAKATGWTVRCSNPSKRKKRFLDLESFGLELESSQPLIKWVQ